MQSTSRPVCIIRSVNPALNAPLEAFLKENDLGDRVRILIAANAAADMKALAGIITDPQIRHIIIFDSGQAYQALSVADLRDTVFGALKKAAAEIELGLPTEDFVLLTIELVLERNGRFEVVQYHQG